DLEMSFAGRSFLDIGHKMLDPKLVALGQQLVATDDSNLRDYSCQKSSQPTGCTPLDPHGVSFKYQDLIQKAIDPTCWNAPGWVVEFCKDQKGKVTQNLVKASSTPCSSSHLFTVFVARYTVMEYNFKLYFGLAVNEYEKLLIADSTPFD